MAPSTSHKTYIAPTAIIDPTASIGPGTKIWAYSQVGEHARVGSDCVVGNGVYIDRFVRIGDRVHIHNKALLYHGLNVESDVFIGPGVVFTNDPLPRSGRTRNLKGVSWKVGRGASIGANTVVLPDVDIGAHAMVGAGSVVTKHVPSYALVCGNPAKIKGYICPCGGVKRTGPKFRSKKIRCPDCGKNLTLPSK